MRTHYIRLDSNGEWYCHWCHKRWAKNEEALKADGLPCK